MWGGEITDQHIAVSVEKCIEDLIPTYLERLSKEVATLRALLAAGDFEQIGRVGRHMKGVRVPYGFGKASALGKQIQARAEKRENYGLEKYINEYADFLPRVQIDYE